MDTLRRPDDDEEGLYDRVPLVRWPRLVVAMIFILLAVALIVVENRAGIVPAVTPRSSATSAPSYPVLGTPVSQGPITILPKYLGRQTSAGTLIAAARTHLVLVAVRIMNAGPGAVSISSAAFNIREAGSTIAAAIPYPGHPDLLTSAGLPAHAAAEGVLVFRVHDGLHGLALAYARHNARIAAAEWSLP